jgi:anti-sigma B factor antagonist
VDVSVSSGNGVTVARVTGEVDTYTVPEVRQMLDVLPLVPSTRIVVDLRDVTFLDSSGLGAIIGLYHQVTAAGAHLQLVCGGVTLRLVELMNLDQVIEVVTELDESTGGASLTPA